MADPSRTFHAHCLCKSSTFTFTIPHSSLPLPTHFCHCSICRHTHGTLATYHTPIPPPEFEVSSFTSYVTRTANAKDEVKRVTRYFCRTCGTHILDKANDGDGDGDGNGSADGEKWFVATAIVDAEEKIWDFERHIFVGSTGDGGLATWLPEIGGKELEVCNEGEGSELLDVNAVSSLPGQKSTDTESELGPLEGGKDKLHAHCHCGGVSFYISRPGCSSADPFKDLPDTLTPANKTKWYALNCLCTSCRLASSSPVTSWCFPLISHISLPDGSPYPSNHTFGTAKTYTSSPGVTRSFCGTCGAAVAYACDERPEMVDIAVGLLDAGSGVKAREWLEWRTGRCGYEEDCRWDGFLGSLKRGMRGWADVENSV